MASSGDAAEQRGRRIGEVGAPRDPNRPRSYSFEEEEDRPNLPWIPESLRPYAKVEGKYVYLCPKPGGGASTTDWFEFRRKARVPVSQFRAEVHLPLCCELNQVPHLNPFEWDDNQPILPPPPARRAASKRRATSVAAGDQHRGRWVRAEVWTWQEPGNWWEAPRDREWSAADWREWREQNWRDNRAQEAEDEEGREAFRRQLDEWGWGAPVPPRDPPPTHLLTGEPKVPSPHTPSEASPPEEAPPLPPPAFPPPGAVSRAAGGPPSGESVLERLRPGDIRDPATFKEYIPRPFELVSRHPPAILQPRAKTTRHPVAKAGAVERFRRTSSASALKRGFSRSRFNIDRLPASSIRVESGSEELASEVDEETISRELADELGLEEVPDFSPAREPSPPKREKLKVALDFHNAIQIPRSYRNNRGGWTKEYYIPQSHVDAVERLTGIAEVWVLSFAGAHATTQLKNELYRSGITTILGEDHIIAHPQIRERVTKVDPISLESRPGKSEVAQRLGIDILVDDTPEIIADAKSRGLATIAVDTWFVSHHGGVRNLLESIEIIERDFYVV